MRILFVNTFYPPRFVGGAEVSLRILAETLAGSGHEPTVLALGDGRGRRTSVRGGVEVEEVDIRQLYGIDDAPGQPRPKKLLWHAIDAFNPLMGATLRRVVDRVRPDLVHTHNVTGFSTAIWREVRRAGLPLVHTLHDHHLLCGPSTMFRRGAPCRGGCLDCRVHAWPRRRLSSAVDAVVGVGRGVLERHLSDRFFSRAAIRRVIPNAVVLPLAAPPPAGAGALRLGFMGRLHPGKGLEALVGALAGWRPDRWTMRVAGDGEPDHVRRLRDRCRGLPVRFDGPVPPDEFFPAIDVLVVPSLWIEASPRVVVEAHAFGRPVLASARGGLPDLVEDGRTGLLFDPADPGSIRAAVGRFLDDPSLAGKMGAAARRSVDGFAPASVAALHVDLYRELGAPGPCA